MLYCTVFRRGDNGGTELGTNDRHSAQLVLTQTSHQDASFNFRIKRTAEKVSFVCVY